MKTKKIKVKKSDLTFYSQIAILSVLILVLLFNVNFGTNSNVILDSSSQSGVSASSIIPTGVPEIYGDELGVAYDFVSANDPQLADQTISFLSSIDRTETLEGADLERYINILYVSHGGISCEYCCGARSIIFENGQAACGCAHSYAMRGLAKYLILNHGEEYTDEEILEEVGKWKVLFFPGIMQGKADIMASKGISTDYISLTSNDYRDIEKGQTSGGMVGGC
ncbi:hypothetical protein ISS08_00350 [Candidatus Pacearchaeota archaeon]|nr:hypothetical protein [Candidatus Pacearchaeota archaeon]